jgi:hypothetical protein
MRSNTMASNVAAKKKAYNEEVFSEAEVIRNAHATSNWTATLVRKYLRPHSLGPGKKKYDNFRNSYRRADIAAAWLTVPPAIRMEREAILQGYDMYDSVEEYIAHEAKCRASAATWDAAEDAVDLSRDLFPRGLDWMDVIRARFAAGELTPTQIAAVEKIANWSWEIGSTGLKSESKETSPKPTERVPTTAEVQKFEDECIEVEAYLQRKAVEKASRKEAS